MLALGGLLQAGVSFCRSAGALPSIARTFCTGPYQHLTLLLNPDHKPVDRWNEKRSMYGLYDNIGILGDFKAHPKDMIMAPVWLKGFRGNELQRLIRKKRMVGNRMMTLERHNMEKRIRFLYRRFNRYGKHR